MPRHLRNLACCLLGCLLLGVATPASAEDRALLIGVGRYQVAEANLPGIEYDLAGMRQVVRLMGFKDSQVRVLSDEQATLSGIRTAIKEWLIEGTRPGDRAVFYFSGHGSQVPEQVAGSEVDGLDEVLCPHDVRGDKVQRRLVNYMVDDEFGELLSRVPARKTYVFIDMCHSGTATKDIDLGDGMVPKVFWYEGYPSAKPRTRGLTRSAVPILKAVKGEDSYVALGAARDSEKAVATRQGSLFTRGLVWAVGQAAAQGRPISMEDLRAKTQMFIDEATREKPAKHHSPQLTGNQQLAKQNLLVVAEGAPPAPDPNNQAATGDLWPQLEKMVEAAPSRLELSLNGSRFPLGSQLIITCRANMSGYLNIINLTEGEERAKVLFPNRYHQDNRVEAGQLIVIPSNNQEFSLEAQAPKGRTMVVAFLTAKPINAYREGSSDPKELFQDVGYVSYRAFGVVAKQRQDNQQGAPAGQDDQGGQQPQADQGGQAGFSAGKVVVTIE